MTTPNNDGGKKMKAYTVTTDCAEVTEVVFADKPSEAKQMALGGEWLHDEEYVELVAKRAPDFDDFARTCGYGIASWTNVEFVRRARALGWHETDRYHDHCKGCELHRFDCLPESELVDELCESCRSLSARSTPAAEGVKDE